MSKFLFYSVVNLLKAIQRKLYGLLCMVQAKKIYVPEQLVQDFVSRDTRGRRGTVSKNISNILKGEESITLLLHFFEDNCFILHACSFISNHNTELFVSHFQVENCSKCFIFFDLSSLIVDYTFRYQIKLIR